jgi:competence protein ComEC
MLYSAILLLCVLLGIGALGFESSPLFCIPKPLWVVVAAGGFIARRRWLGRTAFLLATGLFLLSSVLQGLCEEHLILQHYWDQPVDIIGRVHDFPKENTYGISVTLDLQQLDTHNSGIVHPIPFEFRYARVLVFLSKQHQQGAHAIQKKPRLGEIWRWQVKLSKPHRLKIFNEPFLTQHQDVQKRILATARVLAPGVRLTTPMPYGLSAIRQSGFDFLNSQKEKLSNSALLLALILGSTGGLSFNQKQLFQNTGTSHLLAISGMHVGFVYLCFKRLFSFLWINSLYVRWGMARGVFSTLCAFALTILYGAVSGFSIPSQRAVLGIAVCVFAELLGMGVSWHSVFILTLVGVLFLDPLAPLSISFWLSFVATGFLIYLFSNRQAVYNGVKQHLYSCTLMFVSLTPITGFFFKQISGLSLLANWIAIPIVSMVILPIAGLAVLIHPVCWSLAVVLLKTAHLCFVCLMDILELLSVDPFITSIDLSLTDLVILTLSIVLLCAPWGLGLQWMGCFLVFCFGLGFKTKTTPLLLGECEVVMFDVGQGLSVWIRTRDHQLVYDTGPRTPEDALARTHIVGPIKHYRSAVIDQLMISHWDVDHSGGVEGLVRYLQVQAVISSNPSEVVSGNLIHTRCEAGMHWVWDQVAFTVLYPWPGTLYERNNSSCVLQLTAADGFSVLLTGDIEASVEAELVERYGDRLHAGLLIAPHHGSQSSSSERFLAAVDPSVIWISVGAGNRYKHPSREVLQRYQARAIAVFRTDQSGVLYGKWGTDATLNAK